MIKVKCINSNLSGLRLGQVYDAEEAKISIIKGKLYDVYRIEGKTYMADRFEIVGSVVETDIDYNNPPF